MGLCWWTLNRLNHTQAWVCRLQLTATARAYLKEGAWALAVRPRDHFSWFPMQSRCLRQVPTSRCQVLIHDILASQVAAKLGHFLAEVRPAQSTESITDTWVGSAHGGTTRKPTIRGLC